MSDCVPFNLTEEQVKIKEEINGKEVPFIFDGTNRLGEAMAIVIQFVNDEWALEQQLLTLKMLSNSMTGRSLQESSSVCFQQVMASDQTVSYLE